MSLKECFYIHGIPCPCCTPTVQSDLLENKVTCAFHSFEEAESYLKDIQEHPDFSDWAFAREYPAEYGAEYNGRHFYTKSTHRNKNIYH